MGITDQGRIREIFAGICRALLGDLASQAHAAQRMEQLDVYEMRGMEIAVVGEALDESRSGLTSRERLEDRGSVDHQHLVSRGRDRCESL